MELGLTIPLQRHLKIKSLPYSKSAVSKFCWDLHIIQLRGRPSLLAVHCQSRYTFMLFDLTRSEWTDLETTFLSGLRNTIQSVGIPAESYLQATGELYLTRTHGRREVAYLNRAWEDVLAFDYTLDRSTREQPLLDHAVNTKLCRCAGMDGLGKAEERLLQSL